jgi:hypothetical protein
MLEVVGCMLVVVTVCVGTVTVVVLTLSDRGHTAQNRAMKQRSFELDAPHLIFDKLRW